MSVTLADVRAAAGVIRQHLHPTPLEAAPALGPGVHLKLENANLTHSFKIRGALNAVANLSPAEREQGVVAASSGNHAGGLAYAASLEAIDAKIVMPAVTPARKVNRVRTLGAQAVIVDGNYDAAEAEAHRLREAEGRRFVSAYNDPHVIAGQGTIELEILDQLPEVARVLVCVSGGGLIAGIALALKATRPDIEVIGVGAQASPALYNRFHGTSLHTSDETIAEALAGDIEPDCITVPLARAHVDDIVLVTEAAIEDAVRWALFEAGWVVEGGGAVCIAALRAGAVPADGKPTVALVSGGNIDRETLQKIACGA